MGRMKVRKTNPTTLNLTLLTSIIATFSFSTLLCLGFVYSHFLK